MYSTLLATLLALSPAAQSQDPFEVSAQGIFKNTPVGEWQLQVTPRAADFTQMESDLRIESADGAVHRIHGVMGTGFVMSELGQVIVTEATHSAAVPVQLRVLDLDGQVLFEHAVPGLTDPRLSVDGDSLGVRSRAGIEVLDLNTFEWVRHPQSAAFAIDADGAVAGTVLDDRSELDGGSSQIRFTTAAGLEFLVSIPAAPRKLAFSPSDGNLWVLTAKDLYEVDRISGDVTPRFTLLVDGELRDLRIAPNAIHLGARRVNGNQFLGRHIVLNASGGYQSAAGGPSFVTPPSYQIQPQGKGLIPWPLAPNDQHPIGNTYGEYQNYGGSPYLHPGIDVLGNNNQPVYAVADGVVKAVLTTSAQYHWRVAIGEPGTAITTGYLYAHLNQGSIAVSIGDTITKGQYLGTLVPWPTSNFTHCHFARIEDSGNQWLGSWLCPDNPHVDLENRSETSVPFFLNAKGSDLFAFCRNETSTYKDPTNLKGRIDIIARIGDKLDSNWTCAVQTLRYSIYPVGNPGAPVVDNKLSVKFDMALDTYGSGTIDAFLENLLYKEDSTCNTDGDYNSRKFYHVITNSDGDQIYNNADQQESWNTTAVANGDYVIKVVARDAAGNRTAASMTVTVNN